jgi:hypothetical protein
MEDLTDIKNIWRTAEVNKLPDAEQIVRFIKRYRFKQLVKKAALVLIMLLMTILMLQTAIYGSNSSITRIGETCIFIGYFILILSNANSLRRAFNQVNRSNQEFIEYLRQAQRGRLYFYEKVQPFTFVIMTLGLFLCVFESVRKDFGLMLIVYSAMTVILIVMWFIVRPLINKKRTKKLKETIARLEVLQSDL